EGWSLKVSTASTTGAAPALSSIPNQTTMVNTPTRTIDFSMSDPDSPPGNLTLRNNSSNLLLVPLSNIVFGGAGTNRTVKITPAPGEVGSATITITVSDGVNIGRQKFLVTVVPAPMLFISRLGNTVNLSFETLAAE